MEQDESVKNIIPADQTPEKQQQEKQQRQANPRRDNDNNNAKKKGKDKKKGANAEEEDEGKKHGLKTPKGTRDYDPFQMAIREKVFEKIITCFKRHGAVTIETPLFELKETLTGKYGEDSKLIYDLQDQGGELCSLRYDLTVPFARYVAMNRIKQIKRYQIGRVYRRDNPVMTKGRYREFYQCDFDIAGEYDTMVPDAEAVKLITEILNQFESQIGNYVIKLNHRKLLDGIFAICGVPEDKFRTICSSVDKLDKTPWDEVRKEMVEIKGLDAKVADRIQTFVSLCGPPQELLNRIINEKLCDGNASAQQALEELKLLFDYVECYGATNKVLLDLSLARGLDYYTGVIYEAVLTGTNQVGSIAGGGRYDGLIGIFGEAVPAVGFSIGIERLFAIMEANAKQNNEIVRVQETDVMVASIEKNMLQERMKICRELWDNGIKAELLNKVNPKIQPQLNYANAANIPFAIIFGQREIDEGTLQLKDLVHSTQTVIKRSELVSTLKTQIEEFTRQGGFAQMAAQQQQQQKQQQEGGEGKGKGRGGGKGADNNNNNNKKGGEKQQQQGKKKQGGKENPTPASNPPPPVTGATTTSTENAATQQQPPQ